MYYLCDLFFGRNEAKIIKFGRNILAKMSLLFFKKIVLISDVRCTIVHACNNHFQALLPSRLKLHLDKESAHVSIMYALAVLSVCFEG